MGKAKDIVGNQYGRLTVIGKGKNHRQPNGKTTQYWLCLCNCNNRNIVEVRGDSLKSGSIVSCGCYHKEMNSKLLKNNQYQKKYNRYDLSGSYGIGYTSKGEEFYFDLEDYNKIKDYCWHKQINSGFIVSQKDKKNVYFHRLLFDNLKSHTLTQIDHIHGKGSRYDNRKKNLRICTPSQNCMNKPIRPDNTSNHTGVYWYKNSSKWVAMICIKGQTIRLGYYEKYQDAVNAREKAEEQYFGEFSYKNSQLHLQDGGELIYES